MFRSADPPPPAKQHAPLVSARSHRAAWSFFGLCLGLFVLGGLYFGHVFLINVRTLTHAGKPTPQPTVAAPVVAKATPVPSSGLLDAPHTAGHSIPFPSWQGQKPIGILLLGLDRRPDEPVEQSRTDVMLLVIVNPESGTVAMVSLPRDLWVQIPQHGEQRINVAHVLGGPALVKQTVAHNFGVPVEHFARVDFGGFEQIVDALGGVLVDVERPIKDDQYPTEDYGTTRVFIPPGPQLLDGKTALQYVRSRHSEDDFGRMHRQQRFLMALRDRALQVNVLPKLPSLLELTQSAVTTDFGPMEILGLARLATEIERDQIATLVLDTQHVQPYRSPEGADVLLPNGPAIQAALRELLTGAS